MVFNDGANHGQGGPDISADGDQMRRCRALDPSNVHSTSSKARLQHPRAPPPKHREHPVTDVRVFSLQKRLGSRQPWMVRWRITHLGRRIDAAQQFPTKPRAEAFRARGYAFDSLLSIRDFGIEPPAK